MNSSTSSRHFSIGTVAIVVAVAAMLFASLLTFNASPASAVPKKTVFSSLSLDGDSWVLAAKQAVAATELTSISAPVSMFSADPINQVAQSVVLGAPGIEATTLGDCSGFLCAVGSIVNGVTTVISDTAVAGLSCSIGLLFTVQLCVDAVTQLIGDFATLSLWGITENVQRGILKFFAIVQDTTAKMVQWLLEDELGGEGQIADPVLSCQVAQNENAGGDCRDSWFLGQYSIMRQIGMFMLLPLFMLVVIQSVIRGSMFLLVRATFIMLPASIIGGVVVVFFAQLMLNLSDDFVRNISSYTGTTTGYGGTMATTIQNVDVSQINFFAIFWMILIIGAAVIIYIELLLRQLGVYLSMLFMPLAFAALVWPASAKIAKKMVELLIGLIFSKVFIAAAVSLGVAAFASTTDGLETVPGAGLDANVQGIGAAISGTLIFIMAAFAGTKVIQITPSAITAAEGRVMPVHNWAPKGQLLSVSLGRGAQARAALNTNRGNRLNQSFDASGPRAGRSIAPAQQRLVAPRSGQGQTPASPPPRDPGPRWK